MQERNSSIYNPGLPKYESHHAHFAKIREMADKKGYIAKEINFSSRDKRGFYSFEDMKKEVVQSSLVLDEYLGEYLPNYYYTFSESAEPEENKVVFFMEDVEHSGVAEPAMLDDFFARSIDLFNATFKDGKGRAPDLELRNLVYGATAEHKEKKLYLVDLYPVDEMTVKEFLVKLNRVMRECAGGNFSVFQKSGEKLLKLNSENNVNT